MSTTRPHQLVLLVQELMDRAVFNIEAFPGAEEFARLVIHKVTALEVVTAVCGSWEQGGRSPQALAKSVFELAPRTTMCPGIACDETTLALSLSPANGHISPLSISAVEWVGEYLRTVIGPFVENHQQVKEHG